MPLQTGLDTVAIISFGVYSATYGQANTGNIANLYASLGYLEDAPTPTVSLGLLKIDATKRLIKFISPSVHYHYL